MTGHGDLTRPANARRIGLIGLLLLLGMVGSVLLGGGVFADSAAAECPTCEEEKTLEFVLSVEVIGLGTVQGGGISCSNTTGGSKTCNKKLPEGQTVELSATPSAGLTFVGWSGACSGTGICEVTMDESKSVSAEFADITPPAAPTITSPLGGPHMDAWTESPIEVLFNNSGDASAVAFLCSLDNPAVRVPCSSPWTTPKLSSGNHTVYVWAKDAAGNISSPDSTTFFFGVMGPIGEEEPPKEEGGSGTGGGSGTTIPISPLIPALPPVVNAKLVAKWSLAGNQTIFRKLMLKRIPVGGKAVAICVGADCPFKRKRPRVAGGAASLTAFFVGRELGPGVRISFKVTAAGMVSQKFGIETRPGKPPRVIPQKFFLS